MKKNELAPDALKVINAIEKAEKEGSILPMYNLSHVEARKLYLSLRDSFSPAAPKVYKVINFNVPSRKKIKARYYKGLKNKARIVPITIFFHGGGWVVGNLDTHDVICRQLANRGNFDVISIDYGLAPENKFPIAIEDSIEAINFVANNPMELDYDKNKIALCGDSAGGTIASVCCIDAKIKKNPLISFQVLIYPSTHLGKHYTSKDKYEGLILSKKLMDWFQEKYIRKDELNDWRAAPILYKNLNSLPPALVIVAGCDPLKDEGKAFAKALINSGNKVELVEFKGQIHGFLTMGARISDTKKLINLICRKIDEAFL